MVAENAKKALIDIAGYAYRGSPKLNDYCRFEYEIVPKELRSKHGDYTEGQRRIRIYNTKSRSLTHLITTSLHELAHHIDWCNRGTSDHSAAFYDEYRKLLFAALDMQMFGIEEALSGARDAADSVKMKLMIIEYMEQGRARRERVKHCSRISVFGAYDIKDALKTLGFKWNGTDKSWERDLDGNAETILAKVESLIAESGKDIRYELHEPSSFDSPAALPEKWCNHEFTKEEREALLAGKEIWVEKCWSKKMVVFFSCYLKWDGEQLISRQGGE